MKHDGAKGPGKRRPAVPEPPPDAFGTWLTRSLREQFTAVLHEPTPQSLLDIIEADRAVRAAAPRRPARHDAVRRAGDSDTPER